MKVEIGRNVKQLEGYSAFTPAVFPPSNIFNFNRDILIKAAEADRLIGKLDGITHTLPDVDFFFRCLWLKMLLLQRKLREHVQLL